MLAGTITKLRTRPKAIFRATKCSGFGLLDTIRPASLLLMLGGPVTLHEGPTYCTPSCIVGCVPTAWTVLASAWKEIAPKSVADKIFSDAPDWNQDWLSWTPPPPGSQGVNRRMWAAHGYMVTTCNGYTQGNYVLGGSLIFRDFGVNWVFGWRYGVDYA